MAPPFGMLEEALARYGKPAIFNSDQGSQYTNAAFAAALHRDQWRREMRN